MLADRLLPGDEVRVIAPSTSMALVKGKQIELARERLEALGFRVTFGEHVHGHNEFFSTSIDDRLEDLHAAFQDPDVKGILAATGGYAANQLLKYIDYDLIKRNPKVFCGHHDITALTAAIYNKTGLMTYYGPMFSSFGIKYGYDYLLSSFLEAITNDAPYELTPSPTWSDEPWYLEEGERTLGKQDGYLIIHEGEASGRLIGGNLSTLNLLQGTEYMPSLEDSILFIEEDEESHALSFDRHLQSILQLPDAGGIKAILIGRFQENSQVTETGLKKIIDAKAELNGIPVIANVNFGSTQPIATLPVGAKAVITTEENQVQIMIEP